ncbi:hypothetical protein COLSTE_00116 [Collinsella stercoris DSM 13279]|uniref:Uncharacterized protein n=1 Tax=Collinsella stercoris DSM 13279 TaxID=445975 RepID=B6G7S5_9ACTN|nr:hypothetical protein COLSTE_00116 [Collinsella stercoris DSM 13279]
MNSVSASANTAMVVSEMVSSVTNTRRESERGALFALRRRGAASEGSTALVEGVGTAELPGAAYAGSTALVEVADTAEPSDAAGTPPVCRRPGTALAGFPALRMPI